MEITDDMVLVKEYENVKIYEDNFTRRLYHEMCKVDVHGIELTRYHVYKYVSKVEDSFMYVMEDPDGNPFHDESDYESWLYYFEMLRLSLHYDNDLIDMAEKLSGNKNKEIDDIFSR